MYFNNATNRYVGLVASQGLATRLAGVTGVKAVNCQGRGDFFHVRGQRQNRIQFVYVADRDFIDLPRSEVKPLPPVETAQALERLDNAPESAAGRPMAAHCLADLNFSYHWALRHRRLMSFSEIKKSLNLGRRPAERLRSETLEFLAADIQNRQRLIGDLSKMLGG